MTSPEITSAQTLMKIAINNQSHIDSLIGFYRDLIDSYNNERAQWVLHYNDLNTSASDQHLLQELLFKEQVEIEELEKQVLQKKGELSRERLKNFKLMENNGEAKKRLEECKANFRELMNNCKPINIGMNNRQLNGSSLLMNSSNLQNQSKLSNKQHSNPKTAQLELQLINANKAHAEQKVRIKNRIDILKEQLRNVMNQFKDRQDENRSEYEKSLQRLMDLQGKHLTLTSEYFRFRGDNSAEEKRLQEQNQVIRLKNLAILQKLKNLEKSHAEEFKNVDNQVKLENKRFKAKYDEELRKKQEHLQILKQQHERLQDIYTNKMKKFQQELRTTNQKIKSTQQKTKVEVNSLKSQIKILKARLEKEGLHELRKQIAEQQQDDSSQSLDVSELQKINQQVKNIEKNLNAGK